MLTFRQFIIERMVIRVNSKGKRSRKLKCPKGKVVKTVNGRKVCTQQGGRARLIKKLAVKHANRTKKAKGSGFRKRANVKRQRAMRKRRGMGL